MAVLPLLGAVAGYAVGGTAMAATIGAVGGTLLSGMMSEGESGGGSQAPTSAAPTPPAASQMPLPGTLLSPTSNPTDIGAGLEEANPAEARRVSVAAQTRRRGRRSTILTGDDTSDENEYLGGV